MRRMVVLMCLGMLTEIVVTREVFGESGQHFAKEVAPILQTRCLNCHNSLDRKGDFSLQTSSELADSGYVESGDAANSRLLEVLTPDGDERPSMPKDGKPLTAAEVGSIRKWIAAGAKWPKGLVLEEPVVDDFDWWSFKPVVRPEVPAFSGDAPARDWVRTPIDAFVLEKLREKKLTHSRPADRRTLIRRLTYDLIGLPPTPEEVDSFVSDTDPFAYGRLVDRLLASPHYGERWARHWLDVVKYADTCGYDKDKLRPNAWPYRDYVIRSFNQDKPYAQFVKEQLAGDVFYPGSPDGILGLGFIAAGPWDFIGHVEVPETKIDGRIARHIDRDEMVTNTLNTFCSVTIQCARCHNHKFDPFTQKHYYSLQAVFAAVDRAERPYDLDPQVEKRRRQLTGTLAGLQARKKQLEDELSKAGGAELAALEKAITELKPKVNPKDKRPEYGFHSAIAPKPDTEKWVQIDLGRDVDISKIVLRPCHDEFGGIGSGFGFPVRFAVSVADSAALTDDALKRAAGSLSRVVLDRTESDVPNPALAPVEIDVPNVRARFVRVTATKLVERKNDYILALSEVQVIDASGANPALKAQVTSLDSIEAPVRWSRRNLTDGIWPEGADADSVRRLAQAEKSRAEIMERINTPERRKRQKELTAGIAGTQKELASLPQGRMVYAAATEFATQGNFHPTMGRPRTIKVLHRGNIQQPRDEVRPGTVPLIEHENWEFSLAETHSESERRSVLADWITRSDNPTTWRSIVNRIWQYHFGRGLVDSPNDFGRMGRKPTHPELLDWLAAEFRDNGQSFRKLHRLIVTSSVYRQTSTHDESNATVDGSNQYLWRMNRRRLEAEEIRDSILAVSGRLNEQMEGPGYYLFVLEKTAHSPHYEYHKFDPADANSHRRSVYRFIARSQPDPYMTTLDCADSSQSTPRRNETLTSLQALSLLNNRFNLTLARYFAERLSRESHDSHDQAIRAFRLVAGRSPSEQERAQLSDYAARHGTANLCRLLFNLSEFIFVD